MRRALLLILLVAVPVVGQDEREPSDLPVFGVFTQDANVREGPGKGVVVAFPAGTRVEILGDAYGWVRVLTPRGKLWVDHRFVRIEAPILLEAAPEPCAATLAACNAKRIGCAPPQSKAALFNTQKKHRAAREPVFLSFRALDTLQRQANDLVGQGGQLDRADRARIAHLDLSGMPIGEGRAVKVTGFIVGDPHANTGESVNCNLSGSENNDIHISIGRRPTDDPRAEFASVVVEMIPQARPATWTVARLRAVRDARRQVLVAGQLFYDNTHHVNKNPANPRPGQPKRFSLWEVHPISSFWVCNNGRCDPDSSAGWEKLQDMP